MITTYPFAAPTTASSQNRAFGLTSQTSNWLLVRDKFAEELQPISGFEDSSSPEEKFSSVTNNGTYPCLSCWASLSGRFAKLPAKFADESNPSGNQLGFTLMIESSALVFVPTSNSRPLILVQPWIPCLRMSYVGYERSRADRGRLEKLDGRLASLFLLGIDLAYNTSCVRVVSNEAEAYPYTEWAYPLSHRHLVSQS